jgi:predicted nucleic acid-binding protein
VTGDSAPRRIEAPYLAIDVNVVAKWFVEEDLSVQARRTMRSNDALLAPDFLVTELGSVFREKILLGEMAEEDAHRSLAIGLDRVSLVPAGTLFSEALRFALSTRRSFSIADSRQKDRQRINADDIWKHSDLAGRHVASAV